jgi:hypothetical protein
MRVKTNETRFFNAIDQYRSVDLENPPKKQNPEMIFPLAFRDNLSDWKVCSSSTTPVASGGLR